MPMTLKSQRLPREPVLTPGAELVVHDDGAEVRLRVTYVQPAREGGRWVNGVVGDRSAVVWLSW